MLSLHKIAITIELTYELMTASRKRKIEADRKQTNKEVVRKCESSKADRLPPTLKSNGANLNASKTEWSQKQNDPSETESYCGSSYFMSRSDDDASINLLASDDDKENKEKGQKQKKEGDKKTKKPKQTTQLHDNECNPTLSSDKESEDEMLEEELKEREARRKVDDEVVQSMMTSTAGYPGGDEPEDVLDSYTAQPKMGTVCVWCGEEECEWVKLEFRVGEYYRFQVETLPSPLPPPNIMRKRMYRQVAMVLGFVRREKHPHCIHLGIRAICPSPDGVYMGHKNV
jgi:hypothetical protein